MKLKNYYKLSIVLSVVLLVLFSCVKTEFDAPETDGIPYDPDKVVNIEYLKSSLGLELGQEELPLKIEDDYSLFATVIMDDKSGNIYKSAFIQDETGGINLRLMSAGGLYEGDYIRINLKNTTLSIYQNLWQLDSVDVDKNIQKLATWSCETTIWGDPKPVIEPEEATIGLINAQVFESQLVKLEDVQFRIDELGKTYADSEDEFTTVNRILIDCEGDTVIVRTSGFAKFADEPIPGGNGSLVGVVSRYRDEFQLLLRDQNEVNLDGSRCEDDLEIITIQDIRDMYADGTTTIPQNFAIEAVVISDVDNENLPGSNAVVMDDSDAGIVLNFEEFHEFKLGSKIRVNVGSEKIELVNGSMQVQDISNGKAFYLGSGVLPDPVQTTVADVLANFDDYESKLVTFSNATITGGTTFADPDVSHGSLDLNDGTASITLFTYKFAEFAGETVPTEPVTITGIVSVYNSPQFLMRNMNDIE
ncbi:MAG: DUF5689 domain-containing protein [Candidatus Syntrophosphaera sp.]